MGSSSYLHGLVRSRLALVLVLVAAIVGTATIGAAGAASTGLISACVNTSSGAIRILTGSDQRSSNGCAKNETLLSWNAQGPRGATGATGPSGATGPTGPTGPAGNAEGSACTMYMGQPGQVHVSTSTSNVLTLTCVPIGAAPNWTLTPASHDYGDVPVGSPSQPFGFVIANTGNLAGYTPMLTLSQSLQGVLNLDQNYTTCNSPTLSPGANCLVVFEVTPQATGPVSGTIGLQGYPSATATITFNGTPALPAAAVFAFFQNPIEFGNVTVGQTSVQLALLQNVGGTGSGPYSWTISGPDASEFITYPIGTDPLTTCDTSNVPAGGTCQIAIYFTPTSLGLKQAALTVFGSSAAGVQLEGTGQ